MKRYIALSAALVILFTALCGCGGGGSQDRPSAAPTPDYFADYDPNTPPVDPGEVLLPLTDDLTTFEYWTPSWAPFDNHLNDVYRGWLEQQTNVHLELIVPPVGTEGENFMGILLSGDYPDLMSGVKNFYQGGADKALKDGFIVRLNEAIDRWIPNYRVMVERDDETFIQCVNDEGAIWGIHAIYDAVGGAASGLGVRADWLDRAGISVDSLETIDGLGSALTAFKQYTTDGAGPLWLGSHSVCGAYALNGSYNYAGVSYSPFINKDGVATCAALEGLKEYAAQMAVWYGEGLINKDYITRSETPAPSDMWAHGYIGAGDHGAYDIDSLPVLAELSAINPDPNFRLVDITTPKLTASDSWSDIHLRQVTPSVNLACSLSVTSACSDLKVVCQYVDYALSGAYQPEDNGDFAHIDTPANVAETMAAWDRAGCDWVWPAGATLSYDESVGVSSALANCEIEVNSWLTNVIVGAKSADTYDDELLPRLREMELDRVTATYQAALDRYYARTAFRR